MRQPGIVQIGALVLDDKLNEIEAFDTLVNPDIAEGAWQENAIKTHGITPARVANAPSLLGAFSRFASLVNGSVYWCGYNTKFDRDVLWYQLLRYGFERSFPWPIEELDVMKIVSKKLGKVAGKTHDRWKLVDAYAKLFNGETYEAHDALADVRATGRVLREIGRPYLA